MKTLTLTQPWATLVAIGAKRIETRSWETRYRGPLAIHAANGFPKQARQLVADWRFFAALNPVHAISLRAAGVRLVPLEIEHREIGALPLGCVVARCRLVACKYITSATSPGAPEEVARKSSMVPPSEPELSFGDYSTGRFAWILEDVEALPEPIPAKGALGLWEWDERR